jgi:predicted tellurium resistance membrane protein TerC
MALDRSTDVERAGSRILAAAMQIHSALGPGLLESAYEHCLDRGASGVRATFAAIVTQIIILDMVFSLDSIITAVGMVDEIEIMVSAVVVSVALMLAFSGAISRFVSAHPTVRMLALAFLFAIGLVLVADGFDHHVPKGYVYSAMAFSIVVELLNIRTRKKSAKPVHLHERYDK